MDFYTKEWKQYIYRSWKDALPTKYNITNLDSIYDGYSYQYIKDYYFREYYNNKKEYVALESKLEKIFGKCEKIMLLSEEEEEEEFFKRKGKFIEKYKTKVLKTIELLKSYNLEVNLDINDIDFELLALNKVTLKTKTFYQNLRKIYKDYIECNDLLTDDNLEYLDDIDLIYNNVNSFLTSYTEYIEYRNDKYFKLIDSRSFHDCPVIKYEVTDNQIIIEIDEHDNNGFRLILNNPKVVTSKVEEDDSLTERNIELNIDKIIDIYYNNYELYEDVSNHLQIQYCVRLKEKDDRFSELINVDYYADSVIGEEFVINEKAEEYLKSSDTYQNNLKEIYNMINEETYILLSQPYFNILELAKIESYTLDKDLLIKFNDNIFKKEFSLKFDKANIKILKNNSIITKEELDDILREIFEKIKQKYPDNKYFPADYDCKLFYSGIKFKKQNNLIEATILVTDEIEVSILCSKITVLDNNFEIQSGQIKILANSDDCKELK